jgi:peptidoglycan/LPS O-acetylase OafA/YrhL
VSSASSACAGNTAIETAKFGLAAFLLATCRSGAASGVLPRWLVGAGVAAASLLIVSAVALFIDHGPFQFGGPVDLGGGLPAVVWIAALSLAMARRSRDDDVSEARP